MLENKARTEYFVKELWKWLTFEAENQNEDRGRKAQKI